MKVQVVAKLIIDVTSVELPDLLRLPEVARLVDAGRVSIQPDDRQPSDDSSTRQRGREAFEGRATQRGLRVKSFPQPGVSDFVVDGLANSKSVRLICPEDPLEDQPAQGVGRTSRPHLRVRLAAAGAYTDLLDELQ